MCARMYLQYVCARVLTSSPNPSRWILHPKVKPCEIAKHSPDPPWALFSRVVVALFSIHLPFPFGIYTMLLCKHPVKELSAKCVWRKRSNLWFMWHAPCPWHARCFTAYFEYLIGKKGEQPLTARFAPLIMVLALRQKLFTQCWRSILPDKNP